LRLLASQTRSRRVKAWATSIIEYCEDVFWNTLIENKIFSKYRDDTYPFILDWSSVPGITKEFCGLADFSGMTSWVRKIK
jgi:hypothetical protein